MRTAQKIKKKKPTNVENDELPALPDEAFRLETGSWKARATKHGIICALIAVGVLAVFVLGLAVILTGWATPAEVEVIVRGMGDSIQLRL
jgi:TRAP-type mannitol/chloroaromatic compound transport system permease large subunit